MSLRFGNESVAQLLANGGKLLSVAGGGRNGRDSRRHLTRMHCQDCRLGVLALELGSHVSQHLVQSRLGGCVCAESAR